MARDERRIRVTLGSTGLGTAMLALVFSLAWGAGTSSWAQEPVPPAPEPEEPAPQESPPPRMELREGFLVPVEEPGETTPYPAEEPSGTPFSLEETWRGLRVTGSLSLRYRLRWTGSESDQDLYGVLSFDAGDAATDVVTAHVMVRGSADLDGDQDPDEYNPFVSIEDSFDHAINGRLYYAYLDIHRIDGLGLLRLGRQVILETPFPAYVDGARIESEDLTDARIRLGAYGGIPTHLYESSAEGDLILGAYGEARPWRGGKARLDAMYVEDDATLGDYENALYGLALWQNFAGKLELHGRYTFLEGDSRDLLVRATYSEPEWDLQVRASYFGLLKRQGNLALEFDPYTTSLFEYEPYNQVSLFASKGLGENLVVDAGVDARQLADDDDESTYNHEFERYFVTPTVSDVLIDGLSVSLTGEYWNAHDDVMATYGLDVTQRFDDHFKASAGTYYSLFKYDWEQGHERDDVYTYYVRLDYRWSRAWSVNATYEYEDADFDDFSTVKVGALWSF